MNINLITSTIAAVSLSAGMAAAAPIDLTSWIAEGQGTWNVQAGNDSVLQTVNGSPTIFHNDSTSSQGNDLQGEITVQTSGDDDYIGFVLGYNTGDLLNPAAEYLLIDWNRSTSVLWRDRRTRFGHLAGVWHSGR